MKIKNIQTEEEFTITGQINVVEPLLVLDAEEAVQGEIFINYSFSNEEGETYSTSIKEGETSNGMYTII